MRERNGSGGAEWLSNSGPYQIEELQVTWPRFHKPWGTQAAGPASSGSPAPSRTQKRLLSPAAP